MHPDFENPRQTSPEIQNKNITGPLKGLISYKNYKFLPEIPLQQHIRSYSFVCVFFPGDKSVET